MPQPGYHPAKSNILKTKKAIISIDDGHVCHIVRSFGRETGTYLPIDHITSIKVYTVSRLKLIPLSAAFLMLAYILYRVIPESTSAKVNEVFLIAIISSLIVAALLIFLFMLKRTHGITISTPTASITAELVVMRRSQLMDFKDALLKAQNRSARGHVPRRWRRTEAELLGKGQYN